MGKKQCACCKSSDVKIQARGLCKKCYSKERARGGIEKYPLIKNGYRSKEEDIFVKNHFKKDDEWLFEPASFVINDFERYVPDFYDIKRNVWIEVCASRKRFISARRKYKMFVERYPNLNFEIRNQYGDLIDWDIRDLKEMDEFFDIILW